MTPSFLQSISHMFPYYLDTEICLSLLYKTLYVFTCKNRQIL
ncbi:unnamed protein product, partial [Mycena citricolor]